MAFTPLTGSPPASGRMAALARFREPVNGFLHLAGALLATVGTVWLVLRCHPDALRMVTAAVFGLSMVGCFGASTLHHLVRGSTRTEVWLFRVDYAAIYPFIAGSYTPVCVHVIPGPGGLALLAVVWAIALVGVVYQLAFARAPADVADPPDWLTTLLYVVMGWLIVVQLMPAMAHSAPMTVPFAVAGGLAYTIGGVVLTRRLLDFWPGRLGHHEIWHLCVLTGAACHYAYIFLNLT